MSTYSKRLLWFASGVFFLPVNLLAAPTVTCPLTDNDQIPEKVQFASTDTGHIQLVGYLFKPVTKVKSATAVRKTFPAIVMLHGRRGPYSKKAIDANGPYDKRHLSQRHYCWGRYWSTQGYIALHVDSFSPRDYPKGFDKGSHCCRPEAVNERTVRPLDAYGALNYLQNQCPDAEGKKQCPDVDKDRIGIQGWSNGGSTVMNTLSKDNIAHETKGFRAGLAFYPGCIIDSDYKADKKICPCNPAEKNNCSALYMEDWENYAPLHVFLAGNDEETPKKYCERRLTKAKQRKNSVEWEVFTDATHNFDDPENWKPHKPGSKPECKENSADHPHRGDNCTATENAKELATAFFEQHLKK